jgi:hypothetical protein
MSGSIRRGSYPGVGRRREPVLAHLGLVDLSEEGVRRSLVHPLNHTKFDLN